MNLLPRQRSKSFLICWHQLPVLLIWLVTICVAGFVSAYGVGILDGSSIIFHYHGTDQQSRLGYYISSLGDWNGDGLGDVAVASSKPPGIYVFNGGSPVDSQPDYFLRGNQGPARAIDLDGDGHNEIVTLDADTLYEHGRFLVYKSYGDSISTNPVDSSTEIIDYVGQGFYMNCGYIDGDSLGDILVSKPTRPPNPSVLYYSGFGTIDTVADWIFQEPGNARHFIAGLGFIDFNGDSSMDIWVGMSADLDTAGYVYFFLGPDFGANPDIIISRPTNPTFDSLQSSQFADRVFDVGDIDGDGWSDLVVSFWGRALLYKCGPFADNIYDGEFTDLLSWDAGPAGDINNDGYNDLLFCFLRGAEIDLGVFVGGPEFDFYRDDEILRSDLPPLFLDRIGYRGAAIGDFNGDGIDDFMFSCQNFSGDPGDVFIAAGNQGISTPVEDKARGALPGNMLLHQNYPNPFNLSTVIAFDISRRSKVEVTINNVLGQEVRLLWQGSLSAGRHELTWNGLDNEGTVVSSGTYFYRLLVDSQQEVKKMILLK